MVQHKDILIKRCIEKSDEAIKIAEYSLEQNALTSALNRIYYAIFYTVSALAYKHDFTTSKHSKLMGWFNEKFIYNDKIFDKRFNKIYSDAFKLRQENDYEHLDMPTSEQVTAYLADAKGFIETVRKVID